MPESVTLLELLERIAVATEALALEGLEERVQEADDDFYAEWREAVQQVAANVKAAQGARTPTVEPVELGDVAERQAYRERKA